MRSKIIIVFLLFCFGCLLNSCATEQTGDQSDIFQPRMPVITHLSGIEALFEEARKATRGKVVSNYVGVRNLIIVTPDRKLLKLDGLQEKEKNSLAYGSVNPLLLEPTRKAVKSILKSKEALDISVIANTNPIAIAKDQLNSQGIYFIYQSIPFLGYLLAMSDLGHRVVVFEGHASSFRSGVKNTDVLFVDSGMESFLREDWMVVAFEEMRPNSMILFHDRSNYSLHVIKK